MNIEAFFEVLVRRWWVIIGVATLAVGGAWAYSHHEQRIYQATATVFAHPSKVVTSPGDYSSDLSLLSYGSLAQTFASLAQSTTMLRQTGASLGLTPQELKDYAAIVTLVPQTTVLEISVDGPDSSRVISMANKLAEQVAIATTSYFHIFTLTPLDNAQAPSTQVRPLTSRNILYGGLAGLIVGWVLGALSLYAPRSAGLRLALSNKPLGSVSVATAPIAAGRFGQTMSMASQVVVQSPRGHVTDNGSLLKKDAQANHGHQSGLPPGEVPVEQDVSRDPSGH